MPSAPGGAARGGGRGSGFCDPIRALVVVSIILVAANITLSLTSTPGNTVPSRFQRSAVRPEAPAHAHTARSAESHQSEESSPDTHVDHDASYVTHEHCVAQSDEAETCMYHGPFCYDGKEMRVFVPAGGAVGQDARTSMCYDFRHFVPSQSCGYNGPHRRSNLPETTTLAQLQDDVPRMMSMSVDRKWGPLGREVLIKETDESVLANPAAHNLTLNWLDGGLFILGLHHSWLDHTWHFAAAAMGLWDLKRHNSTPDAYKPHALSPAMAWRAAPMDYLLMAGQYRSVTGWNDLRPWIRHLLTMLVQNHTELLWNTVQSSKFGVSPETADTRWICARKGGVLGLKPRMFSSVGDAHVFRMLAYQYVGVKTLAKDDWPPRTITLLTRAGTRSILNIQEIVTYLEGTGLKVNWIQEMATLTFEEQVAAMADTGILIAVHGAGLANVIFMPAHSVVIEVFPYVMYASMYRDLAAAAGLYYYKIHSDKPPAADAVTLHEPKFDESCDGTERHISSPAAFLDYECNWRSKSSPLLLPMDVVRTTVAAALDDIGCRDSYCEVGWKHVNMKNQPKPEAAGAESAKTGG